MDRTFYDNSRVISISSQRCLLPKAKTAIYYFSHLKAESDATANSPQIFALSTAN